MLVPNFTELTPTRPPMLQNMLENLLEKGCLWVSPIVCRYLQPQAHPVSSVIRVLCPWASLLLGSQVSRPTVSCTLTSSHTISLELPRQAATCVQPSVLMVLRGPACLWRSTLRILSLLWRRKWQPTRPILPGESPWTRSLVGYSSWGCIKSDRTEQLTLFGPAPMAEHL